MNTYSKDSNNTTDQIEADKPYRFFTLSCVTKNANRKPTFNDQCQCPKTEQYNLIGSPDVV